MKKLIVIIITVLFFSGYTASAQMMGQNYNQNRQWGMMMNRGGMMQGMMGNSMCPMCGQMMNQNSPMSRYAMMVNRLPAMQQQLSLKDDQVEKLIDLQAAFKKEQIDYMAELRKKQMELKNLLENNASETQVKNQMEACSETRIDMKAAMYVTAGKMKDVLTDEQKKELQNNLWIGGTMQNRMMRGGMMNWNQGRMMQNRNNN